MRRGEINAVVEKNLLALGFSRSNWMWQPATAEIMLVVDGSIHKLKMPSGMSKRQLLFSLGIMTGLAMQAGIKPQRKAPKSALNGKGTEHPHHAG